jgi:hypothetical protein
MEPSLSRRQFDEFIAGGETAVIARLEGLIDAAAPKRFEDQFLEFKAGRATKVDDSWSRALSAFGNTDGGVIIWGIKTSKAQGVDYASAIDKVPDPLAMKGELEKLLQHATDPLLSGVEIRALPTTGDPGFVVCFIPESTYKPHRAMRCQGQPYLGRFSHRTDTIPTAWLRRLFYPERTLRLTARLAIVASDDIESKWQINGFIVNRGPVTAQRMFARVVSSRQCKFHGMGDWELIKQDSRGRTFERGTDGHDYAKEYEFYAEFRTAEPLHPENETWVFQCVALAGPSKREMSIKVTVYSLDQLPLAAALSIDPNIGEQIAIETRDVGTLTIQLPSHELLPVRYPRPGGGTDGLLH